MSCLPGENSAELSRLDVSIGMDSWEIYRRLGFDEDQETSLTIEPPTSPPAPLAALWPLVSRFVLCVMH